VPGLGLAYAPASSAGVLDSHLMTAGALGPGWRQGDATLRLPRAGPCGVTPAILGATAAVSYVNQEASVVLHETLSTPPNVQRLLARLTVIRTTCRSPMAQIAPSSPALPLGISGRSWGLEAEPIRRIYAIVRSRYVADISVDGRTDPAQAREVVRRAAGEI
jgi:hypothetical protein